MRFRIREVLYRFSERAASSAPWRQDAGGSQHPAAPRHGATTTPGSRWAPPLPPLSLPNMPPQAHSPACRVPKSLFQYRHPHHPRVYPSATGRPPVNAHPPAPAPGVSDAHAGVHPIPQAVHPRAAHPQAPTYWSTPRQRPPATHSPAPCPSRCSSTWPAISRTGHCLTPPSTRRWTPSGATVRGSWSTCPRARWSRGLRRCTSASVWPTVRSAATGGASMLVATPMPPMGTTTRHGRLWRAIHTDPEGGARRRGLKGFGIVQARCGDGHLQRGCAQRGLRLPAFVVRAWRQGKSLQPPQGPVRAESGLEGVVKQAAAGATGGWYAGR